MWSMERFCDCSTSTGCVGWSFWQHALITEHRSDLPEVREDPANQWNLDAPSVLALHDHPGHHYLLLVLGVPKLRKIQHIWYLLWKGHVFLFVLGENQLLMFILNISEKKCNLEKQTIQQEDSTGEKNRDHISHDQDVRSWILDTHH